MVSNMNEDLCPILRVPSEILRMIFSFLSRNDLYAICPTQRDWRYLAEPFLYAEIQWTWKIYKAPPVIQSLRSIMHRPELGSFIRTVILDADSFEQDPPAYRITCTLDVIGEDLQDLVKSVETIPMPFTSPRLRRLYIGRSFARGCYVLGSMLRLTLCNKPYDGPLPSFRHLQDVSVDYSHMCLNTASYTGHQNTADALSLFYLPAIERIQTLIDNPSTFIWPSESPPIPSKLTSLDLRMLREGHLGHVLSVTRELKKLDWHWFYRADLKNEVVTNIINLDQIRADLSHVKETLVDLTITAKSDYTHSDVSPAELTINRSFNAFRDLNRLERLEVPIPFLLGFYPEPSNIPSLGDLLPRNIQWLTLTDDLCFQEEWEWNEPLEQLMLSSIIESWLQDWKKTTPFLRGLRLLMKQLDSDDWHPALIEELKDIGAMTGVLVEILESPAPTQI